MTELKSCPFCGGPASYHDRGYAEISCDDCGAEIVDGTPYRESVAEAWNRRALLERDAPMREALAQIAKQELSADMSVDDQLGGDFEGAYDHMIELARAALSQKEERKP